MAMAKSSEQLSQQIFNEQTQSSQKESKDILSDLINLMTEGQGQGKGRKDDKGLKAMELLMMQMEMNNLGKPKEKVPFLARLEVVLQKAAILTKQSTH